LDRIERNIERQTKQNEEAQQVFKWRQVIKMAIMLKIAWPRRLKKK
jgi:hypothetical protein